MWNFPSTDTDMCICTPDGDGHYPMLQDCQRDLTEKRSQTSFVNIESVLYDPETQKGRLNGEMRFNANDEIQVVIVTKMHNDPITQATEVQISPPSSLLFTANLIAYIGQELSVKVIINPRAQFPYTSQLYTFQVQGNAGPPNRMRY